MKTKFLNTKLNDPYSAFTSPSFCILLIIAVANTPGMIFARSRVPGVALSAVKRVENFCSSLPNERVVAEFGSVFLITLIALI